MNLTINQVKNVRPDIYIIMQNTFLFRSCTDIICCILFLVFITAMVIISVLGGYYTGENHVIQSYVL